MNSKFIKVSLIFISGSVLFFAGCGPQDVNDAEYGAKTADSRFAGDILNKDEQADSQDEQAAPEEDAEDKGCPAEDKGCPTGDCEIPPDADTHKTIQMPDQVTREPVKVTPTSEKQLATDIVDVHTTRHVWQPSERHHTVHQHRNLVKRNFLKIVYHPTDRRINRVVKTYSAENQVMPTEEVIEPTIDYGCAGAPVQAAVAPVPVVRAIPYVGYGGWGYGRW